MKRFLLGLLVAAALILGGTPLQAAGTNNFTITNFKSQLKLMRNEQNRSQLETRETITAVFPPNQNRGLERALPKKYDGHPTNLNVLSVTDQNGQALEYKQRSSGDNQIVRIGSPNRYVSGEKTYIITYIQDDVTRYFTDTRSDELYWDINGTEWKVPIERVSTELILPSELAAQLNGEMACYQGRSGQKDTCTITHDGQTIRAVSSGTLNQVGENITIAVGFQPGTFAAYEPSGFERFIATVLPIWISVQVVAFIAATIALIVWWRWVQRRSEAATTVPEYLPPKDASVQTSAQIGEGTSNNFAAQLIDLAVRHYLKLYQVKKKSFWRSAEYELEVLKSPQNLYVEERSFLKALFGGDPVLGDRFAFKKLKSDYRLQKRLSEQQQGFAKQLKTASDWMRFDARKRSLWRRWMTVNLIIGVVLLSPGVLLLSGALAIMASSSYQLNDRALALRRYLAGLKHYISVAETERLKMLQSPEGAAKIDVTIDGTPAQLVKLYEKVLPYAILFGQEKQWGKVLGTYYEQLGQQPNWYSGQAAFNAAVFTSVLSDFGSSGTYGSPTSSSSGGSTGGGFSGGGGGGGGGGGW